jgi:isoleucyl-tRNA synthetase
MLQACGTMGRAPYEGVLTHGFTLDEKGMKMSKSLGNTVAPEDVVRQYGADILRLWVAQVDYTADQRIGPEILKGSADAYRRLRNTLRFLLGALEGFDEAERVKPEEMPELERWVLHRLAELDAVVLQGYAAYDFQGVFHHLFQFCTVDLSAVYFDIRKDALYCDAAGSARRRATRTVLDLLHRRLTTWLAPILTFTMEEVWLERFPGDTASVHLEDFPSTPAAWRDDELSARWEVIRRVRRVVTGALDGFDEAERLPAEEMPELERWVLHRLAELDGQVREGYGAYDFQRVFQALFQFCTLDLSAFYFDIRKDALYCDAASSTRRRAERTVLHALFHRLATWLAPILAFTMEEVWLARFPGEDASVHLLDFPATPAAWLDPALAAKWEAIRRARRVVTGALEIERRDKRIGASLEASPVVHVADPDLSAALASIDFADLCITSDLTLAPAPGPEGAFTLEDIPGVAVVPRLAEGTKCARCWKILPDVGIHAHPGVCARCDGALD